jgi:hypothetical protein
MAGARQQNGQEALVSILKKLDSMIETTNEIYEQSLVILSSTEAIMKNEVSVELKKQTTILMSIESKIKAAEKTEAQTNDPKAYKELLGSLAVGLEKIVKAVNKIDPKSGDKLKEFFTKLGEAMSSIKSDDAKAIGTLLDGLGPNILKFGAYLAVYSLIAPLAMIGAKLLGITIKLLMSATGSIDKKSAEGIDIITGLSPGILIFGLSMALYSIVAPFALVGSILFGLTIRLLMKTIGTVDENSLTGIFVITKLSKDILIFGLSMALYAIMAPIAMIGTVLFGLTIRFLMKTLGTVNPDSVKSLEPIFGLTKGILIFGLSMALYTIMAPIAMIGATLFGLTIRLLMKTIGSVDENTAKGIEPILGLSKGILIFGLSMTLYTVVAPFAMVGTVLFGLTIRLLMKTVGTVDENMAKNIEPILGLAKGILIFGLSMTIYTVMAPFAMVGTVLFGLTIRLLMKTIGTVDPNTAKNLEPILGLAKGVLIFGLSMTIYTIMAPIAMIGTVLFGLTIKLLLMTMGAVDPDTAKNLEPILGLAKGVLLFGLAMMIYTIMAPIAMIGTVLFGLTIRLLLMTMGAANKEKTDQLNSILNLAKGVLLFGLAMTIYVVMAPIAMIGAVLFGLTIRLLLMAMGTASKEKTDQMNSVLNLAKGILLFALAMVITTLLFPVVLIGAIMFSLALFIIDMGLSLISDKKTRRGVLNLIGIAIGIILFGLTLLAFTNSVSITDALFVAVTVAAFGLIFYLIGKEFVTVLKGALAVAAIGLSIVILGLGLLMFKAANISGEDALILGAIVVGLGIAMFIAGGFSVEIELGAIAMIIASAAIVVLSIGLLIFSQANLTMDDALVLGATIVGLGTTMALAGLASPFIILGSAAMAIAGAALIAITVGLGVFKLIGWEKSDGDGLNNALSSVMSGFLGGEMPGGLLASLKFAAQAAARAALLFISIPPMLLAGLALIPITASLAIFKKSGFTTSDADSLEYMIGSVVRAFGIVTDTERQKQMGFSVNPLDLMIGVNALAGAGNVLSSLAAGVQAWANLEVYDWEVINAGTKDAKLVIKGKRKLGKQDFENAAAGMAAVITAIAEPFALVGRLEKGQPSGNPIYDMVFGGGFVSAGVEALAKSGDTIVSLAKGVQAFATMEYTQFEVVGAGTKDAKLVPKGVFKLGKAEIEEASANIAMVIGVVAAAFAQVGKDEAASSGIFSGGFVSKGVSALSGVGENLGAIVDSVLKMANREIPTFDLINAGTKDAKLVPGKPKIISDADLSNAANTIMSILKVVAQGFYDIGKMEDDSSSFWGDGFIGKGVKALGGLGDTVAKVTDSVIKIASGEIPQMKEVDGKLVPGVPIKITSASIMEAGNTIKNIMMVLGSGVYEFGKFYSENKDVIDKSIEVLPNMTSVLAEASKPIEEWAKLKDTEKIAQSIVNFMNSLKLVFDPATNTTIADSDKYFTSFTSNIEKMAAPGNALDKAAANVDKIEKSMKLLKETINSMDLKKLTLTDSLMKSLAILSKNPEAVAKAIEGSIEKSFKELVDAIKEVIDTSAAASAAAAPAAPAAGAPATGAPAAKGAPAPASKPQGGDMATALKSALAGLTLNVNVKNTTPIRVTQ